MEVEKMKKELTGFFLSAEITPCNDINNAIKHGKYIDSAKSLIKKNTIILAQVEKPKKIYFVQLELAENIKPGKEEKWLNKFGLTICEHSPNYLLGAMIQFPEEVLPKSIQMRDFIAIEKTKTATLIDEKKNNCSLGVYRGPNSRFIFLAPDNFHLQSKAIILAEKIP